MKVRRGSRYATRGPREVAYRLSKYWFKIPDDLPSIAKLKPAELRVFLAILRSIQIGSPSVSDGELCSDTGLAGRQHIRRAREQLLALRLITVKFKRNRAPTYGLPYRWAGFSTVEIPVEKLVPVRTNQDRDLVPLGTNDLIPTGTNQSDVYSFKEAELREAGQPSFETEWPKSAEILEQWGASATLQEKIYAAAKAAWYRAGTDGTQFGDDQLAWALSKAQRPNQRSAGLFLDTVPELIARELRRWQAVHGVPRMPVRSATG